MIFRDILGIYLFGSIGKSVICFSFIKVRNFMNTSITFVSVQVAAFKQLHSRRSLKVEWTVVVRPLKCTVMILEMRDGGKNEHIDRKHSSS